MNIEKQLIEDILKLVDIHKNTNVFNFDVHLDSNFHFPNGEIFVNKNPQNIIHLIIQRRITRAVELLKEEMRREINGIAIKKN